MDTVRSPIELWLRQIAPQANLLDRDSQLLAGALRQMGDNSWLALKAPLELSGMGWSEGEYRRLQITLARTSGALTFLQTQHQSAVSKLAQSENTLLHHEFFPAVATGQSLVGVGFSHLRRRGTPAVRARETETGYVLSGEVPWITGYGIFDWFILGATLADGRELYGLLPFKQTQSAEQLWFSEPMELLAVSATNTVSARIEKWHLDRDRLVSINPPGSIHLSSQKNILNHGFYAIGCAYAGLDILQNKFRSKQLEFMHAAWSKLTRQVREVESQAIAAISSNEATYQDRLRLRAKAIDLAQRCSQAAVVASGGGANYVRGNVGRVYREALLFAVSGQTTDVMAASLDILSD